MEINQLKYFKAVADSGKIVLAAEELFVTPSAISASLASLEKELDTELFVRSGNRLSLNRQGRIFLDYANHILECVSDAKYDLLESMREMNGHLLIGFTATNLWVDLLAAFSKSYPLLQFSTASINVKDIHTAGLNSRFSFLFASEDDPDAKYSSACESITLFEDAPAVMVRKDHPLATLSAVEPEMLLQEHLVLPRINPNTQDKIFAAFRHRDLPLPRISTHFYQVSYALVQNNFAVAITTLRAMNTITKDFAFIPILAPECRWKQKIYWRKKRALSKEEQLFLNFVKNFYDFD